MYSYLVKILNYCLPECFWFLSFSFINPQNINVGNDVYIAEDFYSSTDKFPSISIGDGGINYIQDSKQLDHGTILSN